VGIANAAGHNYSYVADGSGTSNYTAISVNRPDKNISTDGSGSGCSTYFSSDPIYQTQWITSGNSWVELGTGHQCSGSSRLQYWYAGYAVAGSWYPIWEHTIEVASSHRFWVQANGGDESGYSYFIDVTNEAFLSSTASYSSDLAGLESYDDTATVTAYTLSSLEYGHSFGSGWSSFSGTTESVGSTMCGRLVSSTEYVAGENTTC